MEDQGVPVADAIERLRDELEVALEAGRGRRVQFGLGEITMTMTVVAGNARDGSGKLRWWLVEAGGGVSSSTEKTQTLVVTLRPQLATDEGTRADLLVGATDLEAVLDGGVASSGRDAHPPQTRAP